MRKLLYHSVLDTEDYRGNISALGTPQVSSTSAVVGRTTRHPVYYELLKSSISAIASPGEGYYVCLVRLIDARTTQYPGKPVNILSKTKANPKSEKPTVPSFFNQATIQMSRLDPNP